MPLIVILVKALQIALVWVVRSMLPWLWRTVIVVGLRFVWQKMLYPVVKLFVAFFAFLGRNIITFFTFIFAGLKGFFVSLLLLATKARLLLYVLLASSFGAFFKWAFLTLFAVILYKVLEVFGVNLLVVVVKYLLLALSYVLDILITLIFGMIDFSSIIENFNTYFNALPSCFIEVMLLVGLTEALNSLISTCILLITIRFAMLIIRR